MSQTTNYGFNIYTDNEVENLETVRAWRKKVDGTESDSNMNKIDAALKNVADSVPAITVNPTLAGTENIMQGIEFNGTKYAVPQGTSVVANPTLAGTEANMTSLEVGGVKYKIVSEKLKFTDVSASNWVSDNTYNDYGYKCELTCTGITSNSVVEVMFALTEAISGNYAPVCLSSTNTVTIYSKVNATITIPVIKEV